MRGRRLANRAHGRGGAYRIGPLQFAANGHHKGQPAALPRSAWSEFRAERPSTTSRTRWRPSTSASFGSIAALAVAVLGVAIVIVGVTLIVEGITIASRYDTGSSSSPPNLGQLGQLPIWGGIGMLVLGLLLTAAPLALLADVRFSRPATMLLALIAGGLAVAGLLAVIARPAVDPVVTISLGLSALIFGASALILARPGR